MNQNNSSIVIALGSDGDFNYSYPGPLDLTGATLTFVLNFDSAAAAASSKAVVFHSLSGASNDWYVCDSYWFVAGDDTTYSCSNLTGSEAGSGNVTFGLYLGANAGTVTVKSATLQLAQ